MLNDGQMFAFLTAGATALATVIWYLIRRGDQRVESERDRREIAISSERAAREASAQADRKLFMEAHERTSATFLAMLEKEREASKSDRHDFRDALSAMSSSLSAFKLEASDKFVNRTALVELIFPLKESIEGLRRDLRDLNEKLDSKADKRP